MNNIFISFSEDESILLHKEKLPGLKNVISYFRPVDKGAIKYEIYISREHIKNDEDTYTNKWFYKLYSNYINNENYQDLKTVRFSLIDNFNEYEGFNYWVSKYCRNISETISIN